MQQQQQTIIVLIEPLIEPLKMSQALECLRFSNPKFVKTMDEGFAWSILLAWGHLTTGPLTFGAQSQANHGEIIVIDISSAIVGLFLW